MVNSKQCMRALVTLVFSGSLLLASDQTPHSLAAAAAVSATMRASHTSIDSTDTSSNSSSDGSLSSRSTSSNSTPPSPRADAQLMHYTGDIRRLNEAIDNGTRKVFPTPLIALIRNYIASPPWELNHCFDNTHRGRDGNVRAIHAGAWSPSDPHLFATAGGDGRIRITDVNTTSRRTWPTDKHGFVVVSDSLEGHGMPVSSLSWHPSGSQLASGSSDSNVMVWDIATGNGRRLLTESGGKRNYSHPGQTVYTIAYNHDGSRLASGAGEFSKKGSVSIWNPAHAWSTAQPKPHPLVRTFAHWAKPVSALAWLKHKPSQLVASAQDNTVRLYDTETGEELQRLNTGHVKWTRCLAITPDNKLLTSGTDDTVRLFDFAASHPHEGRALQPFGTTKAHSIAHAPNVDEVAAGSDNQIIIVDRSTGKTLQTLKLPFKFTTNPVNTVAYNCDGSRLAACDESGSFHIYRQTHNTTAISSSSNAPSASKRFSWWPF
jgi:WD40 repeat protein